MLRVQVAVLPVYCLVSLPPPGILSTVLPTSKHMSVWIALLPCARTCTQTKIQHLKSTMKYQSINITLCPPLQEAAEVPFDATAGAAALGPQGAGQVAAVEPSRGGAGCSAAGSVS